MAIDWALFTVKLIHVLGATLWIGLAVHASFIQAPALKRLPARARIDGFVASHARTGPILGVVGLLTVLLGFELARMLHGSFNPAAWASAGRPELLWGMGFGLAALLMAALYVPAVKSLTALARTPLDGDVERRADAVIRRLTVFGHSTVLLLTAALVTMVASNLGGF